MDNLAMIPPLATREDLIECYRLFLDRKPENDSVLSEQLKNNPSIWKVIESFYLSKEHAEKNNRISLYYIARNFYLMKYLSTEQKINIYVHNASFFYENISLNSIVDLMERPPILYRAKIGDHSFTCTLQFERDTAREGEFSLYFCDGLEQLYCVSFTFVPGAILGLPKPTVILVSRMQGKKGKLAQIKRATKACLDIAPQAILWAVLQGVAIRMGVDTLVGADASRNLSYDENSAEMLMRTYDRFYESVGAKKLPNGVFLCDLSADAMPEKALTSAHRARNKRKREFKRAIIDEVIAQWPIALLDAAEMPAPNPSSR